MFWGLLSAWYGPQPSLSAFLPSSDGTDISTRLVGFDHLCTSIPSSRSISYVVLIQFVNLENFDVWTFQTSCTHFDTLIKWSKWLTSFFQGYIYTSTVDYLSHDKTDRLFIWILMVTGWILPNIAMIFFHFLVVTTFRFRKFFEWSRNFTLNNQTQHYSNTECYGRRGEGHKIYYNLQEAKNFGESILSTDIFVRCWQLN